MDGAIVFAELGMMFLSLVFLFITSKNLGLATLSIRHGCLHMSRVVLLLFEELLAGSNVEANVAMVEPVQTFQH